MQMTVGDLKAQFSMVLAEIQKGNDVEVLYGRGKKPVAIITAIENKKKPPRKLGTLNHLGPLTEVDDGKITLEEFFGVESLDELEEI